MKNLMAVIIAAFTLVACDGSYNNVQAKVTPPELADCHLIEWNPTGVRELYVVRCPNSTTTTNWTAGKHSNQHNTTVVIDGQTYQKVENP